MVILNKESKLKKIRSNRFHRFGFFRAFPPVKKFRKTNYFGWLLVFAVVLIFVIYKFFGNSKEPVHQSMAILTYTVAAFGILVKLILSLIFPEIKMDKSGLKILGHGKFLWNEIKFIKTGYDSDSSQFIIIKKRNNKTKKIIFEDCNFQNLRFYAKSFLKKYGKQSDKLCF